MLYDKEFINLYSKDNPILKSGDTAYCLIFNTIDYHIPCVCKCVVIDSKFVEGLNVVYNVRLIGFEDTPNIQKQFIFGKQFSIDRRLYTITPDTDFNQIEFKIKAFFIRQTIEQIMEVKKLYQSIVKNDLNRMLNEIE